MAKAKRRCMHGKRRRRSPLRDKESIWTSKSLSSIAPSQRDPEIVKQYEPKEGSTAKVIVDSIVPRNATEALTMIGLGGLSNRFKVAGAVDDALNLKTIIEADKLTFCDYDILSELTTFIQKSNSFEAEEGCNDDLAMCLVIYAWLVCQDYFKELTDHDVRKRLYEEQKNQIEQDMAPFGFMSDGLDDMESFVDAEGDRWHTDEYGDRSYMWEYM